MFKFIKKQCNCVVASKKEEIEVLQIALRKEKEFDTAMGVLKKFLYKGKTYPRIEKFILSQDPMGIPDWKFEELLKSIQLGWKRYFYACSDKESIFVRIYMKELKSTKGCSCCLYWRGILSGILIAIIVYALFNLGKILL